MHRSWHQCSSCTQVAVVVKRRHLPELVNIQLHQFDTTNTTASSKALHKSNKTRDGESQRKNPPHTLVYQKPWNTPQAPQCQDIYSKYLAQIQDTSTRSASAFARNLQNQTQSRGLGSQTLCCPYTRDAEVGKQLSLHPTGARQVLEASREKEKFIPFPCCKGAALPVCQLTSALA